MVPQEGGLGAKKTATPRKQDAACERQQVRCAGHFDHRLRYSLSRAAAGIEVALLKPTIAFITDGDLNHCFATDECYPTTAPLDPMHIQAD